MNTFHQTDTFSAWLMKLKDTKARARIVTRVRSAEHGNFGDCAPVGEGVSEMRLHFGPGYRLYFWQEGSQVYWLLAGVIKAHRNAILSGPNSYGAKSRS
ncbi:type II toxin-antitoxin system RelE/ParE family toxin [Desulfovibrio sp. OttesenSCG-928-I05]|nr:type II toxin-antitoxin system RelE/ParE family toxin [Desulfovibrio sp. OttesenSCG-928-I05]